MHVVIVGAGVGGLGAAYELVRAGHTVALYEASDELGGQVRTFEIGGGRIESFYHHLFRSDTVVTALIHELGLGGDIEWIDSKVGFMTDGRIFPFVSAMDLLRYTPVSLPTRVRLGLAALWLRAQSDWKRYEGMRARDWIVRYVGREAYDRVWGALLRAKFGAHAEDVAMVWFWGKIYLRFASRPGGVLAREQLGYLRGSFGRLVDALAAAVRARGGTLETSAPVAAVLTEGGRARGVRLASGETVAADAVIATVPSGVFVRLVPGLDAEYAALLQRVEYQWATVLVLALDRPLSSIYWLTVTEADCPFVVAVEQTNFRPPAEYGGQHVVYFSNYADPGDPIVDEDAEQVLARYEPYIRRINPAFDRGWIRGTWLFKDRAGQPIVHARYHELIPPLRTPTAGLYLANTTQIYPEDRGQNYAIRLGQRVARLAIADGLAMADTAAETGAGAPPQ
ncbi:MAG: NAD(P)/FAD-dependent oxidoreductase [Dehalococcoidia bacterium]|nr:NAD(P)/FAD-dependent oxidoreductase [Dehalococcoidia bacterium]